MGTNVKIVVVVLLAIGMAGIANAELVGHWTFDEGTGTTAGDSSGHGNNGTILGATWTAGKVGGALSFDGVNDYVDCGNGTSLDNMPTITLAAWIYANGWGGSDEGRIISKRHYPSAQAYELALNGHSNYKAGSAAFYGDNGIAGVVTGYNNISFNNWYHLAATSDGVQQKIYINGVLMGTTNFNTGDIGDVSAHLWIGQISDAYINAAFNGKIDDVRIYNNVLSQSEIQALVPEPATIILLGTGILGLIKRKSNG